MFRQIFTMNMFFGGIFFERSVVNHLKYQQGVRSTTYYDFFDKSIYFLYSATFRAIQKINGFLKDCW